MYHTVSRNKILFTMSIYLAKYISIQGVELRQDVENGILFTNYSLVLQKITRNQKNSFKTI